MTGRPGAHGAQPEVEVGLDGAQVLWLDRDDRVWRVQAGSVELYCAPIEGEAGGSSARRFLFRVGCGEIVYPAAAAAYGAGLRLLALGQDARLRAQPLAGFHASLDQPSLAADGLARLEAWCTALAACLELEVPAARSRSLVAGQVSALGADDIAYPQAGLCWARLAGGAAQFLGDEALPLTTGEWLPLTTRLWLQATEVDTAIEVRSSEEILRTGGMEAALLGFQDKLLPVIGGQWRSATLEEQARLQEKAELERARLQRALAGLAEVSARTRVTSAFAGIDEDDALLGACQLVARALGSVVQAPPPARPGRQATDAVSAIAQASRLRHRPVILRGDWWRHDGGPLLAFVEADGRPLALLQDKPGRYQAFDTASRERQPVDAALAAQLRPQAYSFLAPFPRGALTPAAIWRFARRGCLRDGVILMLCGLAAGLLGLFVPILSQQLFDDVIPLAERSRLLDITFLMVLFAIAAAAFELTRGMALLRIEALMEIRLEAGIMDRLLRLPAAFFKNYQTGDLALRVLGISSIRRLLTASVLSAVMTGMFSVVSLALLFYYDTRLALLGLALGLVATAVTVLRARRVLHFTRGMTAQEGRVSSLVFQFMNGIAKLRVAGAEKRAFAVWAEQFAVQKRLAYESGAAQNHFETFNAAFPIFASLAFFAAVYLIGEALSAPGAAQVAAAAGIEQLSTGRFIAVITAFGQFLAALLALGMALIGAVQAIPLYERAQPILEALPEVDADCRDPGTLSGEIELSHVSFRYGAAESGTPLTLDDVSLRVAPGQMVAIVGPSGSGKSTLLRLLLGLERPLAGSVNYDGQPLDALDIEAVRRQIGVVLQKDRVQPGDVFHNIVGVSSNLTLADAWEAARLAGLESDINAMPMGMHTNVNEGGTTFSGGQRQRLLIARAIVHKPRVLFFDEATSALDNHTQKVVGDSLRELRVTRVVIAHRLSTIQHADRIVVLDHGRVVETGTYAELAAAGGLFATLIRRQLA